MSYQSIRNKSTNQKRHSKRPISRTGELTPSVPRFVPGNNQLLHRVQKYVDRGALTSTSAANGYYGIGFQFQDIPDYTSWQAVFDQYRIDQIDLDIRPMTEASLPGSAPGYSVGWVAVDYDDNATPGTVSSVANYSNVSILSPGRGLKLSFRPKVDVGVYNSGAAGAGAIVGGLWMDMAYPAIQYHGVKVAITASTSTNVNAWYILARYTVSMRSSR